MANTRTVGAAGDHTTIGAALAWFQTAAANHQFGAGGDGIGTIEVIDATGFNEEIDIDDLNYNSGAPTSSSYLVLTVDADSRHEGLWSDSKGHIDSSSSSQNAIIQIDEDYTVIEYLQISQDSSTNSDEGIRILSGVTSALISRCIIRYTGSATNSTDGIYIGNWAADFSVDNSIFYGFRRGGIHLQNFNGTNTISANADHCTVFECGLDGSSADGGFLGVASNASSTVNFTLYNCGGLDSSVSSASDFQEASGSGTFNWAGTHNCSSDASLTSRGLTTGAQESLTTSDTTQSSGTFFVVKELDTPNFDYQLLDDAAGNIPAGNGTNRQGSEPDSRQDFSTDVAGNVRSASVVDIGASQVSTDSVTASLTGTMTASVDEDDITTGGKTIIITLTGDTFKAAGTGPIGSTADTQALIDGFDTASSPTNGWNNEVRDKALTSEVVRTSSTIATWTVAAQAGYDVSAQEIITGTIPIAVLVTGAGAVTATPTFTIDPVSGISIPVIMNHLRNQGIS